MKIEHQNYFSYFLVFLTGFYFLFIASYSVNQYDLGFQLSLVHRLANGEMIYKDFDSVRPFLSVFLWDLFLKPFSLHSDYLILLARSIVVLESILIAFLLKKLLFDKAHSLLTVFLSICFLHTFPIMPWHTIDGILFSLLALIFLQKKWLLSTLVFLLFAALTKQSFFVFAFVMALVVINDIIQQRKLQKEDFYIAAPCLVLFLYSLFHYHIFENGHLFFQQVFQSSVSGGFLESAVLVYFSTMIIKSVGLVLFLIALYFVPVKRKWVDVFLFILMIFLVVYPLFNQGVFVGIHSTFLLLMVLFFKYEPKDKFIFYTIFLAWASSISWGYNTPIFLVFILLYRLIEHREHYFLALWTIVLVTFTILRLQFTYLSDSVFSAKYLWVKDTTVLSGLFISEKENQYILEAQAINKDYPHVVFLPGSPLLDVINHSFPNRASWEMDVEYPSWKKDFPKLNNTIFAVDNQQIKMDFVKTGLYQSSMLKEIIQNKKLIKKTKYFTLYGN